MNLVSRPDLSLWLPPNLWESKLLTLFFVGPVDEDVRTPVSVPKGRVSGSTWMQADEMLESQAAAGKALQENHFQGGTCLHPLLGQGRQPRGGGGAGGEGGSSCALFAIRL